MKWLVGILTINAIIFLVLIFQEDKPKQETNEEKAERYKNQNKKPKDESDTNSRTN